MKKGLGQIICHSRLTRAYNYYQDKKVALVLFLLNRCDASIMWRKKQMKALKLQIAKSFRMEMIGTGFYRGLSAQYRKHDPRLSEKFREFAGHEYMHSRLFSKHFREIFGRRIRGGGFWFFTGSFIAFMMKPMTLKAKLKKLNSIESKAVSDIEKVLDEAGNDGLSEILKIILPDEQLHANLYKAYFPA